MKRDDDKKAIGIWLDCYNKLKGTNYRVCSYPDEQDRNRASIDALCENSEGGTLGVEHTRIEAFPGEMTDNDRFMKVLGKLENDPSLAEIGVQARASIEVATLISLTDIPLYFMYTGAPPQWDILTRVLVGIVSSTGLFVRWSETFPSIRNFPVPESPALPHLSATNQTSRPK